MQTSTTPGAAAQQSGKKIVISGRLSYPDIFKPRAGLPGPDGKVGEPRYGCHIIIDPASPSLASLKAAFMEVSNIKWGPNAGNILAAMGADKKCVRSGNTNLDKSGNVRKGYEGMMFCVARSKMAPLVLADKFHGGKAVHLREDGTAWQDGKMLNLPWKATVPYGGCYVNAQIEVYAMEGTGAKAQIGKGVHATLLALQFLKDGEAFGGSRADESDFSQVGADPEVTGSEDDPFNADPFAAPAGAAAQPARSSDPF